MVPTPGRIVLYKLAQYDADAINRRRKDYADSSALSDVKLQTGFQAHVGNHVNAGDVFPAVVVRVWSPEVGTANLHVFLDGNDTYWATSRVQGDGECQWSWPPRV
jgi:hypothetical protein